MIWTCLYKIKNMTHCITNHAHKILHLYPLLFIHFVFLDKASWACLYHFLSRVLVLFFFKDCLLPFLASCSWQHPRWITFSCLWQPKSRHLVRPVPTLHFLFKTQFQYGKAWSVVGKVCFHPDIQGSNSRVIAK
jgi:hypothetical protein